MIIKERLANEYLFFRYPTHHFLILLPIIVGIIQFFLLDEIFVITNLNSVSEKHEEIINNYLMLIKISYIILLSIFLSYRWTNVISDGSYGYWMTQGVSRMKLVFLNLFEFLKVLVFAEIIGLFIIMTIGGLFFAPLTSLYLVLLIISNAAFLIIFAYFIGIKIKSPEIAALTYIIINLVIILLSLNLSSGIFKILQSDLQYNQSNALLLFFLSLITSSILFLISIRSKINMDLAL